MCTKGRLFQIHLRSVHTTDFNIHITKGRNTWEATNLTWDEKTRVGITPIRVV